MRRLLIVAHLDDEILWFNPQDFEKIIVCCNIRRIDKTEKNEGIYKAWQEHPLQSKIIMLGFSSGKYWLEKTAMEEFLLRMNQWNLGKLLKEYIMEADEVYTHNAWGEYGHSDHIMVHEVVGGLCQVFEKPVWFFNGIEKHNNYEKARDIRHEKIDLEFFRKVKNIYLKNDCWTWKREYEPASEQQYFREL